MKKFWMEEVVRSALQTRYYGDFRYAEYRKAMADMCYAITIPDDRPIEACETEITGESLGRYMNGRTNNATGKYYYTTPTSEKMDFINAYVGELSTTLTAPHVEDMQKAVTFGTAKGYDRIANQSLFAGAFRGTFLCEFVNEYGAKQIILQVHHLKDEPYFRVRIITAFYNQDERESMNDLDHRVDQTDWDEFVSYDGFAVTGTNSGNVFFVKQVGVNSDVIEISNYSFFEKGRRILSFDAILETHQIARFKLITKPDEIAQVDSLLGSIPD